MEDLFCIREVHEADIPSICALSSAEGMGEIEAEDLVFVAANDEDQVVGFIRLVFDDEQVCHVNPVAVYPAWRRYGVGKALVEHALELFTELRLVSRGNSLAFYQALGFEPVPWESIYGLIAAECDECPYFAECAPVPVSKRTSA